MIRCLRQTALGHAYRVTSRLPPQRELSVVIRGRYRLAPGEPVELLRKSIAGFESEGALAPAGQQQLEEAELVLGQLPLSADVFRDATAPERFGQGELVYPTDWAEFKPKGDFIVKATCHPPRPTPECTVAVEVKGRLRKELLVVGPRVWVDRFAGGAHSDAVAFQTMPIDWEHAFGGPEVETNPVGRGQGDELPNVEYPKQRQRHAGDTPPPACFGPVSPGWAPRKHKLGEKWGDSWQKSREPYYAEDYDWTHQNAAPEDQQVDGHFRGDERLRFENLVAGHPAFEVTLPAVRPRVFVCHQDERIAEVKLVLDTINADLDAGELFLCWRGLTPVKEDDLTDVPFMLVAEESLDDEPAPEGPYHDALRAFAADPQGYETSTTFKLEQLEAEIESGAIDERIDGVPKDQDPVATILLAPVLGDSEAERQGLEAMNEKMAEAEAKAPGTQALMKAELKKALRLVADGGGAPAPMKASGGIATGAFLQGVLQKIANAQAESGEPQAGRQALIQRKLQEANIPGVDPADLVIPAPSEEAAPGPGADFSYLDLTDRDFSGADLRGARFCGANLSRARLRGALLDEADFTGACLGGADLHEASLKKAVLQSTILTKTKLTGADLTGADLRLAIATRTVMSGAILDQVDARTVGFHRTRLDGVQARQALFIKAVFDGVDAEGADFSSSRFDYVVIRQSKLARAVFFGAVITHCLVIECEAAGASWSRASGTSPCWMKSDVKGGDFRYADLQGASFLDVDAADARLNAANLPEVRFYRVVLSRADLDQANLIGSDLRKTVLSATSFRGANLYDARLMEAHGADVDFRDARLLRANFRRSEIVRRGEG